MIDGYENRLVYDEALPMPRCDFNPQGTGYETRETVVSTSGGYDLDFDKNRIFKIQNASVRNPVNGKPVAYKIHAPAFQKILSDADSFNYKRAEFADKNIYVVKYRDDELYAGGKYTNQSRGGAGVRSWASRRENIVDEDLVLFVQFGINHVSCNRLISGSRQSADSISADSSYRRLPGNALRDNQSFDEAGELLRPQPCH
jgi:primary-amine oxidase